MQGSLELKRGVSPIDADVVVIPIDSRGSPGQLNRYVLEQFKLDASVLPDSPTLHRGFAIRRIENTTFVFVVTANGKSVETNLKTNLVDALTAIKFSAGIRVWVPLIGAGVGLSSTKSLHTIYEALVQVGIVREFAAHVVISAPNEISETEYEVIRRLFERLHGPGQRESRENDLPGTKARWESGSGMAGLMQTAAALIPHKISPSQQVSTTLLLFSLSVADEQYASPDLHVSADARYFAAALKYLAGQRFRAGWDAYFHSNADSALLQEKSYPATDLPLTRNCQRWVEDANALALKRPHGNMAVSDLIDAIWEQKGNFKKVLESIGVDIKALRMEFEQRREAIDNSRATFVRGHLMHDHATADDLIDFTPYAVAIQNFLTSPDTRGPICVSIQAPWGAGKSSLMRQVRLRLDPRAENARTLGHATIKDVLRFLKRKHPEPVEQATTNDTKTCWTIWFNAWKYESSEQVWAGLVDAIIAQVSDRLEPKERELFLLRLNLARIDDGEVRRKIYDRLASYLLPGASWVLLGGTALISAMVAWGANPGSGIAVSALALAGVLGNAWRNLELEPAKFSLADYVKVPDYGKSVGVIHQIHRDLQRVINVLQESNCRNSFPQLVIFIDDLDRCSPNKVASIVEGINMFLASDQKHFLFVIGMDPQIVAAALEHAHKDIKGYLPSYEQVVPLGWRFMDKFVQLAFTIPPRSKKNLEAFVEALAPRQVKPAAGQSAPPVTPVEPADSKAPASAAGMYEIPKVDASELQNAASEAVTEESKDVLALMQVIIAKAFLSPREIKRALNLVRFVLLMRVGRVASGKLVPSLELYGRWVVLSMRWPDMARWLQWSADDCQADTLDGEIEGVTAARLSVMENAALLESSEGIAAWSKAIARQLSLPDGKVSWLADPELYQFFLAEAKLDKAARLSWGASIGFY